MMKSIMIQSFKSSRQVKKNKGCHNTPVHLQGRLQEFFHGGQTFRGNILIDGTGTNKSNKNKIDKSVTI